MPSSTALLSFRSWRTNVRHCAERHQVFEDSEGSGGVIAYFDSKNRLNVDLKNDMMRRIGAGLRGQFFESPLAALAEIFLALWRMLDDIAKVEKTSRRFAFKAKADSSNRRLRTRCRSL
jgi:hypothetical protein